MLSVRIGHDVYERADHQQIVARFGQPLTKTGMLFANSQCAAQRTAEPVLVGAEHLVQGRFCQRYIFLVQICAQTVFWDACRASAPPTPDSSRYARRDILLQGNPSSSVCSSLSFPAAIRADPVYIQRRMTADRACDDAGHTGPVLWRAFQVAFIVRTAPPS